MYDTRFFIATFPLKERVVSGAYNRSDARELLDTLNRHLRPRPFVFNIETTNYCNMRCIMCQRTTLLNKPLQHMSPATFRCILEQLEPQRPEHLSDWTRFVNTHLRDGNQGPSENNFYYDIVARTLTLHGFGEPLLDPALPERVALLAERGIPTYFSCNPTNLRLPMMRRLFEAGLDYIKVAVDGLDDDTQEQVRGVNADFTVARRNVLEVLELKERMGARTQVVATKLNFGDQGDSQRFLELWEGTGVYAYIKSLDNKWLLDSKGLARFNGGENASHYKRQYCEYAWTSVTILTDGSVVPCTQDLNGEWTFGNVNEQPLEEIWRSDKYMRFRELQVMGDPGGDFMCHTRCDLDVVSRFVNEEDRP